MLHRKTEKELEKLNLDVKGRIIEAFKEMKEDPFAGDVKLVKGLKGVFRRRVGSIESSSQYLSKRMLS
jgi:mRNA-degrading endonuclease RelE of RelBE toxin-antitoxin system